MFELSRFKKLRSVAYVISVIFFLAAIVSFTKGGGDSLFNYPFASVFMLLFLGLAVTFFFIAICMSALQKDISEELKYLSDRLSK